MEIGSLFFCMTLLIISILKSIKLGIYIVKKVRAFYYNRLSEYIQIYFKKTMTYRGVII